MNEITYHKAGPKDAQTLADLRIRFAIELSGEQSSEKTAALKQQLRDYFSKATGENKCISIIAKSNDLAVGIGSIMLRDQPGNFKNMSGKWAYVMNMYTMPEFRKRGICTRILELLENEAKQHGIGALELHATVKGEPVYLKGGFKIHNEPTLRKYI